MIRLYDLKEEFHEMPIERLSANSLWRLSLYASLLAVEKEGHSSGEASF